MKNDSQFKFGMFRNQCNAMRRIECWFTFSNVEAAAICSAVSLSKGSSLIIPESPNVSL